MAGLPPGWEWDYDGQRWFYKYKPTGHIQYHFPSEGDEFPDFIEAGAPAPDLAPEERLESQQQVKRQTSSAGSGASGTGTEARRAASASNGGVNKYGMSATAKPISAIWEGDDEGEVDGVFQPENFMFLGPGTYADVSPLMEEEEEMAKRTVVGAISERVEGAGTPQTAASALAKGVSPLGSGKTTPMMAKSEPSVSPRPADAAVQGGMVIESPPVIESAPVVEGEPVSSPQAAEVESTFVVAEAPDSSAVHMIDSREMPVEMMGDTMHRFDPVGFVAEMPTEHTAVAHVELHPDPVEIADNSVLAPIETAMAAASGAGMAELPAKYSPVDGKDIPIVNAPKEPERKQSADADNITRNGHVQLAQAAPPEQVQQPIQLVAKNEEQVLTAAPIAAQFDADQGKQQYHGHDDSRYTQEQSGRSAASVQQETFKIARKQPGSPSTPIAQQQPQQPTYQAYVPGQTTTTSHLSTSEKRQSIGLQREVSLMMNVKRDSVSMDPSSVPQILSPPQNPGASTSTQPATPPQAQAGETTKQPADNNTNDSAEASLTHIPSILKPARNRNSIQGLPLAQQPPTQPAIVPPPAQPQEEIQKVEGVSKFPSVLRPARGRSPSQPGQGINNAGQVLPQTQSTQQIAQNTQPGQDSVLHGEHMRPAYQTQAGQPPLPSQNPPFQQPPWQAAQAMQPARPASAMPVMNHAPYGSQYSVVGPTPVQQHQSGQAESSEHGRPASQLQPSPLQRIQEAVASQPPRPQTVVGTIQPTSTRVTQDPIIQQQQASSFGPLHQVQDFGTVEVGRISATDGLSSNPLPNASTQVQQQSVRPQSQVQASQQFHTVEAGQLQPQPQHQPQSASWEFHAPPIQHVQNAAAGQPLPSQSIQPVPQVSHVVEASQQPLQQRQQPHIPASDFQVQPLQTVQNSTGVRPLRPQSTEALSTGFQPTPLQKQPPQQQRITTASQFQVQPLQNVQNASAGQPIRPPKMQVLPDIAQSIGSQGAAAQQQPSSASHFQVPLAQNIQNAAAGQPTKPQDNSRPSQLPVKAPQTIGVQNVPTPSQQPPVSQFQVPQSQNVQNASAGSPQQSLQQRPSSQFQVPALQQIQNAAAGQPIRPQSANGSGQHTPASDPAPVSAVQYPQQSNQVNVSNQGPRRASTFTPGEVSPVRPREDSQVSALGSPSPMDPSRRSSSNANMSGPNYTPSPMTDATGPAVQTSHTQSTTPSTQGQSPPVPAKIRAHAAGSFFPVQNSTESPPSHDKPPTQDTPQHRQQQQLQQHSSPPPRPQKQETREGQEPQPSSQPHGQEKQLPREPTQDTEHPIGYQVKQTANQANLVPIAPPGPSTPSSGHVLGRIEEHDECEPGPKPDQTPQVTRPSSMASSVQQSIPDTPGSPHGPTLHQPKPVAPSQVQRPVQALGQSPAPQSPMGQPPIGQPVPGLQPQPILPTGQMPGQMQNQIAPGRIVPAQMPPGPTAPAFQGQWNPATNPNAPPQGGKEKEKKWTKWFKGGSAKPKPAPQQMMPPQPGPIPNPGPQQWTGGPYSPSHFWQQPGQQGPFSHGNRPSMSDSASISTVGSDKKSQHSQNMPPAQGQMHMPPVAPNQLPGGQMMMPGQPNQLPGHGPIPGQLPQQMPPQMRVSGTMVPGQGPPGQMAPIQMRPGQQMPGQPPPGQMPPAQGYFGQVHPLQMPITTHSQGFAPPQSGFQPQGQTGMGHQGQPSFAPSPSGHSKTPSISSQASIPPQGVPPLQMQAPANQQPQQPQHQNMMPAPLFAGSGGNRPPNGTQPQVQQAPSANVPAANNKWAQRPAADYSGGDWGDEENWERR
ncbi:hypothetical protein VFPPC_06238 [Pochonia chlamydosporia 170]|uniref:WW domain-containing protein n=1 Tax=Pochonia chlamydosporia 170 TaxID=1380566 RepID=A0A179FHN3_METCM|nr:hypothetical protein VFPPC_06238 [Pochonia chlamydosporia 170]OAQ65066.1 hypothetical protein VFPPC_06238 [Pochonia chlamydosporia 170]